MTANNFKIAYQGAPGAFSHAASRTLAEKYLKQAQCELLGMKSFSEVFAAAQNDSRTYACLPIDNSSIGSISDNYDLLWDAKLSLMAQFCMPIHHQLLAIEGSKIEQITEVYSHPAALEQCRKLFQRFPRMHEHPFFDTAAASKMIKEKGSVELAAIGSEQAAREYGLEVLSANIEDYQHNQTRFVLVGKTDHAPAPQLFPLRFSFGLEGGRDLNALTALAPLLGDYVQFKKIESRPNPAQPWEYRLFIDLLVLKGHSDRSNASSTETVEGAGKSLEEQIKALIPQSRFFGSYNDYTMPT